MELSATHKRTLAKVIAGKLETMQASNIPPVAIKSEMEKQGYKISELDTNGWQYDWWLHFTKGSEKWTAFGSGYYGTFEFSKTEE